MSTKKSTQYVLTNCPLVGGRSLRGVYDVMKDRHSNLQMQVGFEVDYPSTEKESSIIRSSEGIEFFKLGVKNLGVILEVLLNRI